MKLGGVSAFRVVSMSRARQRQQPSSMLQFPHVFSSSRIPEVTLESFSVRFCSLFVLPCLAVLLSAGASFALLSGCVPFCSTARAAIRLLMLDLNSS